VSSAIREANLFAPLQAEPGAMLPGVKPEAFELHFFSWSITIQSIVTAFCIGTCATVIGWPLAWLLRRRGWQFLPLVATPLLLPNYLAFGAYNLLRAPGSVVGDLLERSARGESGWIPVFAGQVLAFASLSLWSAPLSAIVLAIWLGRVETSTLEQLSLDLPGRWFGRSLLARCRLAAPGIVAGIGIVTLLMLGSAVPLHVARLETLTIRVWLAMDLLPQDRQWRAWIVAWPLLVLALAGAWMILRFGAWDRPDGELRTAIERDAGRRSGLLGSLLVFAAGAVVPLCLFASHLASAGGLTGFVRVYRDQIVNSAVLSAATGAFAGAMMLAAWMGMLAGGWSKRIVQASVFLFAFGALAPGVMIGVWLAAFVRRVCPGLEDSSLILVVAHLARFGVVPVVLGCWLAWGEAKEQADQRRLDGATGLLGVLRTAIAGNWQALGAGAIIVAILSFHEIECAVVLQPPGVDTFARAILNQLHFARTQELSAAGILLLSVGLVLGGSTLWWMGRTAKANRSISPS
jgi:ABC-type Fe3+ transport system permease subunit